MTSIDARPVKPGVPYILQGNGRTYELDEKAFNAAVSAAMAVSGHVRTASARGRPPASSGSQERPSNAYSTTGAYHSDATVPAETV